MNNFDEVAGLEKGSWNRFFTQYNIRRAGQVATKFDSWGGMQLPSGSVLHSMREIGSGDSWLPNVDLPLIANEQLPIYLKMQLQVAGEHSQLFGIRDTYVYQPGRLVGEITHFFQTHKRFRKIISDRAMSQMTGVLTWIDYGALGNITVRGPLHEYRKFDLIFRTMLDQIVTLGSDKQHYIVFPQHSILHTRTMLQRTFSDLSTKTLNQLNNDPSVYPLLHVLGYVFGQSHQLKVIPFRQDVVDGMRSTSLLERLPEAFLGSVNFIFHQQDRAVVYRLADLKEMSADQGFYPKLYRHFMGLRDVASVVHDDAEVDSETFDTYVESAVKEQENATVLDASQSEAAPQNFIEVKHDDHSAATQIVQKTFVEKLISSIEDHHDPLLAVDGKKKERLNTLTTAHLNVSFAGKSLKEWMQQPAPEEFAPKDMSFLKDVPEESYKESSLIAMDRAYQRVGYTHELAKVVGSLAKHGYFVTKTEEEHQNTEMDQTVTYKFHLQDLNGKSHHLRFTVPEISRDGLMKLSGVDYRLTRQMANVPISKVSPFRVSLSSYYNKILVERIQSKRWSYEQEMVKLITALRDDGLLEATLGSAPLPTTKVAYDYTAIGQHFTDIKVGDYHFQFTSDQIAWDDLDPVLQEHVTEAQINGAVVAGQGRNGSYLIWTMSNQIHVVKNQKIEQSWSSFRSFLADQLGADQLGRMPVEWTNASILNQTIPLVYILAYQNGLKSVLDTIRLDYRFYPKKRDVELGVDDIAVPMADGVLVFNRYPLSRSLIASGLLWADLRDVSFNSLSLPDSYISIFAQKGLSVGVLKGLRGFFSFFVDPITETVLEKMGEPTTFSGLLLRANVMLTDYHAQEPSSVGLHRFRLYERFNGIIYNEIYARGLANYRGNPSTKKSFSINPQAVFQRIVQDATVSVNDLINPVHEVKQRANFTFTGVNGRAGQSFMPKDRIYPKDGLGVISDAVPDSGKVGITAYLSASPRIDDIHGIPKPYKEGDVLAPPQILSVGSMCMPGGTTDDGKRNSYLSIQISHYVPNHEHGETLAVRTGYDQVLPHLVTDVFSVAAEKDGVVESIDEKSQTLIVRYADKPIVASGKIKLPYLDQVINQPGDGMGFGYLVSSRDVDRYPVGGMFQLTSKVYGEITDRLRLESVDAIPDQSLVRKQADLIKDFERGRFEALYYLRFMPKNPVIKGEVKAFSYQPVYSQNSGSYLLQTRLPNVKVGESFKTGDILIYNPGFFVPDPLSKQVTFKHGVTATIALIEKASNHEDACEIGQDLSNRLQMTPCHLRPVVTMNSSVVLAHVRVGDYVETSDTLCVISDHYLVDAGGPVSMDNLDIIEKLNRQTPSAQNTGKIKKLRILYGCERDQLSDSLKVILKGYEKEVRDHSKALSADKTYVPPERPGWVAPGTRYQGVEFTDTTVILEFMIEKSIKVFEGDKIVIGNANKSVVSHVNEKPHITESGVPIDILFSTTSVINRVVMSPFSVGMAERNQAALKAKIIEMYFGD